MENSITATEGVNADLTSTKSNSNNSIVLFHDNLLIRLLKYSQEYWSISAHLTSIGEDAGFEFDSIVYALSPILTYIEFSTSQICSETCSGGCKNCPIASAYKDLKCRSSIADIETMSDAVELVIDDLS